MFFRNRFNAMLSGGRANERRIGKAAAAGSNGNGFDHWWFYRCYCQLHFGKLSLGIGIGEIALVALILTASDPLHFFEKDDRDRKTRKSIKVIARQQSFSDLAKTRQKWRYQYVLETN